MANVANTISTNLLINSDDKKVRYKIDCYILHTITITCYHYAKHRSKLKNILLCQQHKIGE